MSAVHPAAAKGFAGGAESYRRGRPDYPPETDAWLRHDLGIGPSSTVLDLGAGTGKFTARLVASGAAVFAVEPVTEMRAGLAEHVPAADVRAGTAEAIPLPDASLDAVVCATSFHWFATPAALAEIRRVLKPGGRLGLIWNVRDQTVPWVARFTSLLETHNTTAPRHHHGEWRSVFPAEGFSDLVETTFRHAHIGDPEDVIVRRGLSVSFIAALPVASQTAIADDLRALIAATPELAGRSEVAFPYLTQGYCAERHP